LSPISYNQFAQLARRRGWTAAYLGERFRGRVENPQEFFNHVLQARHAGTVIPYRSVIKFYRQQVRPEQRAGGQRSCACGCQKPVSGRKKLASAACRKRMERRRARTPDSESEKHKKDGAFFCDF